jgi:hypothetical protein
MGYLDTQNASEGEDAVTAQGRLCEMWSGSSQVGFGELKLIEDVNIVRRVMRRVAGSE